eukprot:10392137-Alexandrium_andersonii.AAC.1
MSASLVGSEMCIRDSPNPQHAGRTAENIPTCGVCDQRRERLHAARLGAVSYTHLTLPTICSV